MKSLLWLNWSCRKSGGLELRGSASPAVDRFYALYVHMKELQFLARGVCPAASPEFSRVSQEGAVPADDRVRHSR
jgi:hypothetical protein